VTEVTDRQVLQPEQLENWEISGIWQLSGSWWANWSKVR